MNELPAYIDIGEPIDDQMQEAFERWKHLDVVTLSALKDHWKQVQKRHHAAAGANDLDAEDVAPELGKADSESKIDHRKFRIASAALSLATVCGELIDVKKRRSKYDLDACRQHPIQGYIQAVRSVLADELGESHAGILRRTAELHDQGISPEEVTDGLPGVGDIFERAATRYGGPVSGSVIRKQFKENAGYAKEGNRPRAEAKADLMTLVYTATILDKYRKKG
jgi:hypothetical protein